MGAGPGPGLPPEERIAESSVSTLPSFRAVTSIGGWPGTTTCCLHVTAILLSGSEGAGCLYSNGADPADGHTSFDLSVMYFGYRSLNRAGYLPLWSAEYWFNALPTSPMLAAHTPMD